MKTDEMTEIKWTCTKNEHSAIARIVNRAEALYKKLLKKELDRQSVMMDLEACHCNGNPLDLAKLETFPDFDFSHDVFGISKHMDRNTGKLRDCFVPRCSR